MNQAVLLLKYDHLLGSLFHFELRPLGQEQLLPEMQFFESPFHYYLRLPLQNYKAFKQKLKELTRKTTPMSFNS